MSANQRLLRQSEGVQRIVSPYRDVLATVHLVCDWTAGIGPTETHVPNQFAVARIQGQEISFFPPEKSKSEAVVRMPLSV